LDNHPLKGVYTIKKKAEKGSSYDRNNTAVVSPNNAFRAIMKVLLVDDDAGLLSVAKECLEAQGGFGVDTALSVEEAIEKLENEKHDAIISDYQMPGKDGLQFLKELRSKGNEIPFIIFTGKGREEVAIKALNLGADRYLNKSGDPDTVYCELAHAIRHAVETNQAEEKIRESEQELRSIFDAAADIIAHLDSSGKIVAANWKVVEEILGYSRNEIIGMNFACSGIIDARDLPIVQKAFKETVKAGRPRRNIKVTLIRKDGSRIQTEVNSDSLKKGDRVDGIILVIRDVTKREEAEEIAREAERRYRQLFDGMPSGVVVYEAIDDGADFVLVDFNTKAEKIEKVSKQQIIGKRLTETFPGVRSFGLFKVLQNVWRTGQPAHHPMALYEDDHGNGTWRENWVYKLPSGNIVAIYNDVTESRKTEDSLKQQVEFDKILTDIFTRFAVCAHSEIDACVVQALKTVARFVGVDHAFIIDFPKDRSMWSCIYEWCGPNVKSQVHNYQRIRARTQPWTEKMIREGKAVVVNTQDDFPPEAKAERRSQLAEGALSILNLPMTTAAGEVAGCIGLHSHARPVKWSETDVGCLRLAGDAIATIIKRKKAEEALEQRNRSLSVLNDVSNELASLPPNATIQEYLVKRLRDITGAVAVSFADYDSSKRTLVPRLLEVEPQWQGEVTRVLGKSLKDMRCPVSKKVYREIIDSVIGERKELTAATFGGIPPSMGAEVQKMLGIDRFIGIAYVIEGELYGTSLLALKSDTADPAREILKSFAQMASVSLRRRRAEERMRESERALQESQRRYQTIVESVQDGLTIIEEGKVTYVNDRACEIFGRSRAELLKTNGVDLAASEAKERLQRIQGETINSGKALEELEFWIARKDGTRRCILNRYSHITKDGSTRVVATTDITARKNTVDKLETVTQKLQVVGGLTRHDVRNKLSAISSNAFLAKKTLTKGHKALTHLERIESACKQAASILDFAAIYEKLGLEKLTLVDVGTSIDEAVSLFPDMKSVDVVNECHGVSVLADSLLSQLFYNLIDNSLKHGKKVNLIRIHCEIRKKGLKLSYEDNGVGIPKANKPKLFDEGFSTGNGQGYGLPLIKKMIEVYGWTIEESGEVDKGAKFIIRIPTHTTSNSFSPQLIQ